MSQNKNLSLDAEIDHIYEHFNLCPRAKAKSVLLCNEFLSISNIILWSRTVVCPLKRYHPLGSVFTMRDEQLVYEML